MEKVVLIDPKDGENTHIQSHEQINKTLILLNNEIEELKKEMKSVVRKQNTIDKLSGWLQIQYTNAVKALKEEFITNK